MIQVAPYTFIAVTHPLPSPYIYTANMVKKQTTERAQQNTSYDNCSSPCCVH